MKRDAAFYLSESLKSSLTVQKLQSKFLKEKHRTEVKKSLPGKALGKATI